MIEIIKNESNRFFSGFLKSLRKKSTFVVAGVLVTALSLGQTKQPVNLRTNLFKTLRPDLTIVVHKHPTGADMVEVSMLNQHYPPSELKERLMSLRDTLGVEPRGLNVFAQSLNHSQTSELSFLKATFATNGILNGPSGINLQALVRIFAGGTGPSEIKGIDILLDGVAATPATVSAYLSNAVEVQGFAVGRPPAVEYRIHLLSKDPKQIEIPERAGQTLISAPVLTPTADHTTLLLVIGFLLASAAAGALVYTLILRRPPRTDGSARSVHR